MSERAAAINQPVADSFETGFLAHSLGQQVEQCERYELAPLFLRLFSDQNHQPVLEAGCGSGRWCAWFHQHAIRSDGVDWSQELCERAGRNMPHSRFVACDMAAMPFADWSYGGLIALGSIEHSIQGPQAILREFYRLLAPGGIAVITVPFGGGFRALFRHFKDPWLSFKASPWLRRFFGKAVPGTSLAEARKCARTPWNPRFSHGDQGWFFFEYQFTKPHMRAFLDQAHFQVLDEFVAFGEEGILHNFGPLAAKWNEARGQVDLSTIGRIVQRVIPVRMMGHMLCYVVRKSERTP